MNRIAVTLFSIGLAALSGCAEEREPPEEVIRGVLTRAVDQPGEGRDRVFSGVARSRSRVELSFQVSGKVQSLYVKVGDIVEEGALVAELDPTDLGLAASEARATLAQARAEARNQEANYGRLRALYEKEGVSRGELDQARAGAESAKANVSAAGNRLAQAERQLRYAKLRTPSAGAVSSVPVELSENVQSGQTVAIYQTGGPPEVEIAMPESLIPSVRVDDKVRIAFDAFDGEAYAGQVRKVGVAPEDGGTTYPVTVQVDADWDRIRPGMSAQVRFRFASDASGSVVVPTSAVGHDRNGHYVFLVDAEADGSGFGSTQRKAVTVGDITSGGISIESGLSGGERVVIAGVPRVRDGLRVRILSESDWP